MPPLRWYYFGILSTIGSAGMSFYSWFHAASTIGPSTGGAAWTVYGFLFLGLTLVLSFGTAQWMIVEERLRSAASLEQAEYETSGNRSPMDHMTNEMRRKRDLVPPLLQLEARQQQLYELTDEEMQQAKEYGMTAQAYFNRYKRGY